MYKRTKKYHRNHRFVTCNCICAYHKYPNLGKSIIYTMMSDSKQNWYIWPKKSRMGLLKQRVVSCKVKSCLPFIGSTSKHFKYKISNKRMKFTPVWGIVIWLLIRREWECSPLKFKKRILITYLTVPLQFRLQSDQIAHCLLIRHHSLCFVTVDILAPDMTADAL